MKKEQKKTKNAKKKKKKNTKNLVKKLQGELDSKKESLERKRKELQEKEDVIEDLKRQLSKALSDYHQLQKRTQRDVELLIFNRISDVSEDLVEIVDNVNYALKEENKVTESWVEGIINILEELPKLLKDLGLEEIKVKEGDKLDPQKHEAIMTKDSEDIEKNHIVDILQKGYLLEGKVLKPAKVVVAK
jgi:molecular chaperone GrpE